jgi:uncharacterized protein (DUF2147 family)
MIKQFLSLIILLFSALHFTYASAVSTPVGKWITISDKTHDQSGIIEIKSHNGKLYGKIIKIFPGSDRNPAERCSKCPDNFYNKPVLGLIFLWGFQQKNDNTWEYGQLLDPKEGNIYHGSLTLINHGAKLEVRGYWGPFWRTQTWIRQN